MQHDIETAQFAELIRCSLTGYNPEMLEESSPI